MDYNNLDIENVVGDEIRKYMKEYIGTKICPDSCENIKTKIVDYLQQVNIKMNYCHMPIVKVENEGPFVTVNFFDHEGKRLETLGGMLEFMKGY